MKEINLEHMLDDSQYSYKEAHNEKGESEKDKVKRIVDEVVDDFFN